jgi:hypothetical protein
MGARDAAFEPQEEDETMAILGVPTLADVWRELASVIVGTFCVDVQVWRHAEGGPEVKWLVWCAQRECHIYAASPQELVAAVRARMETPEHVATAIPEVGT